MPRRRLSERRDPCHWEVLPEVLPRNAAHSSAPRYLQGAGKYAQEIRVSAIGGSIMELESRVLITEASGYNSRLSRGPLPWQQYTYSPVPLSTAGMVLRRILISNQKSHVSIYLRSSVNNFSNEESCRAEICQSPVRPGITSIRLRSSIL
jgi:hypothetical protein